MTRVRIDVIAIDAGTQIRAAINEAVVTDYAERMTEGVSFPAIVVFHDGSAYYLADGFHRVMAARRNAFRDIDADVRAGTKADALWFALGANKANGQRLTDADKKHAVKLALQTWPEMSQNQIADQVGCSQRYVSMLKEQVRTTSNLPDRVTGKDGKSYPASRPTTTRPVNEPPPRADRVRIVREMAEAGHTSRQIASAIGVRIDWVGEIAKRGGIVVHADRVVGKRALHNANRIVAQMVLDAENLCADVNLIEFEKLDRSQLPNWLRSLQRSRDQLGGFIRRLMKEQQNGEAA